MTTLFYVAVTSARTESDDSTVPRAYGRTAVDSLSWLRHVVLVSTYYRTDFTLTVSRYHVMIIYMCRGREQIVLDWRLRHAFWDYMTQSGREQRRTDQSAHFAQKEKKLDHRKSLQFVSTNQEDIKNEIVKNFMTLSDFDWRVKSCFVKDDFPFEVIIISKIAWRLTTRVQ